MVDGESAANGADMPQHDKHLKRLARWKRLQAWQRLPWRHRAYELLEHGPAGERSMRVVSRLLILLVLINIVAVVLESVPRYEAAYGGVFVAIETVSLVVFTVEYLLRIWIAAEHAPNHDLSPLRSRWRYIASTDGLIDLASVLPFWLAFAVPSEFRIILLFRIVRFLKLARYSPALRSLLEALYSERRALFGCLVILTGAILISASFMHLVEGDVQPDKFGTIPDAMWWSLVTLGTVGYGDVVPMTALGKLIAAVTILCSFIMVALPVGIIATAFSEQIHRRDFVVTWGMVARVPLFAGLDAAAIADIMRLLRAQTVDPGDVIVRRGDNAHSMYFIAGGKVDIDIAGRHISLGVGQFFGEMAVLQRARRSATVTATTRTNLLVLDASDFHLLMEHDPRIAQRVHAVVRERVGLEAVSPKGDIASGELSGAQEER
jgi:voltage-gated potassium channel